MSVHEHEHRPLSGAQEGLWFAGRLAPHAAAYNTGEYVEIHGPVDPDLFEVALRRTVAEADTFALRFSDTPDGPRCRSATAPDDWPLHRVDVSTEPDPGAAAEDWIRRDLVIPVDLASGPLFSHALIRLAADRFIWFLKAHHIVLDGYGYKLVARRLAETYTALADGREPEPAGFEPVARLQAEEAAYLASERHARDREHWAARLAGLPEPVRLTERTAPPEAPFLRSTYDLSPAEADALNAAAARLRVSRTDLLVGAVTAYVHRMTGAEDLVLGLATMSRPGSAALRTPGTASDILPLRVAAPAAATVEDLVQHVVGELRPLRRHQQYRGEFLRRDLGLLGAGRRVHGPVVNIVPFSEDLVFDGHPTTSHHLSGGAVDDLQITVRPGAGAGGLWLAFDANPATYEQHELDTHLRRFRHVLRQLTEAPGTLPLAEVSLLLPGEEPQTAPARAYPVTTTLTRRFEDRAALAPHALAVTCEGESLDYAGLNAESNRLARLLVEHGAGPGRVVALALPRGIRLVVALLAVLKSGAAYLPLDTGHPAQRLRLVTEDVPPTVLVTDADTVKTLPVLPVPTVVLGAPETAQDLARRAAGDLTDGERTGTTGPGDTAYIIHTSGSTGRPKGVPVPHANVLRLFASCAEHFDFGEDDVWTLFHSYAFDFSVWEIWGALLHGGRLVVVPHAVSRSPRDLLGLLRAERVTVLNQTPSAFEQLMLADLDGEPTASALKYVVFGGEALRPDRLRPWADRYGLDAPALINMYGITETTVHVTFQRLARAHLDDPRRPSVIGVPLADLCVHLLDAARKPVPPGVVGEMYVSGAGLAPGYLDRPELTAERFVEDPFGPPGGRMYRTGDLARRTSDGVLEYVSRADEQVKIRGFRVEPGEIQAVLAEHPGVACAAVVARRGADDRPQLVAYAVPADGRRPRPTELRAHLAERLPGHMVPAACVLLDALPLTANGKLDTRALPEPDLADAAAGHRPSTPEQKLVCRLFAEVLRLPADAVGVTGNFFDLGGHSLLAVRLLARLRAETGHELPISVLFDTPTPTALAVRLAEDAGREPRLPALEARRRPARVPLSFAQERMWFLNRLDGAAATYNIPLAVSLEHEVDVAALRAALADVVDRHESLRTVFADDGQGAHQLVLPPDGTRPELRIVDCPAEEAAAQVALAARHRFDLTRDGALWAALIGTGATRTLLLVLHHSAADGWSLRPLADDLSAAYEARREGRAPHGKPLPVQYADFALWQRGVLSAAPDGPGRLEQLTEFWRGALAGLPAETTLPADRPRSPVPGGGGAHVTAALGAPAHRELLRLAEAEDVSLFMVLHAALGALLCRWGAGDDLAVGTPVAGRSDPALDDVIGLITNTLVLRTDISGDPGFRELLGRTRRFDIAALDHQDLPFDLLVDGLNPPRHPARHPLFQVMLALQNNEPAVLRLGGQAAPLRPTATGTAKFDLFVDVLERRGGHGAPEGLDLHVEYATDLFAPKTAACFAEALSAALEAVCADPGLRVSALPAPPPRATGELPGGPGDPVTRALGVAGVRDAVALAPDALYVVPGRAGAADQVEQALDAARVTAVNTLPRTPDGVLDADALRALPPVDSTAATRWQRELARLAGVREAAVRLEEIPDEPGRIHTGLPRPARQEQEPHGTEPGGTVPALSEGGPLPEPTVPGWAQALTRAAALPHGEIVHVRADGGETRRGYASLADEASRVLGGLRRQGLRPGDQVILQCSDTEDFVAVLWGCILGGFVAVPLTVPASYTTPSAAVTKLEGIWRMLDRPWIVASPDDAAGLRALADRDGWPDLRLTTADALREAPEDRDWHPARPDDLILMLMTSGSTGLPKAVRITHRGVLTRSVATAAMNGLGEHDVSLNWIPLDHVTGVVMFHLRDVYLGCRQVHAPTSWILQDPLRWADLADRHRVTVTWAPNFAFGLFAEQAHRFGGRTWDLSPMRLVMNAGEVVVASAARRFLHVLRPYGLPQDVMHPGWGMSETCSVVTDSVLPAEPGGHDEAFVSCGLPYPGFAMRVVGEHDALLAEGRVGRLQVRGTSVTRGYHDNAKANAESFTADGWFDTGDLAFLRDGELYITGRAKDVIIVNGVNHYSHEIEACVEELPCVTRSFTAAVAVRSDPSAPTDELALFFRLTEGQDPATALREIGGKVTRENGISPAFLVPVSAEDIPKTEIGKIQRTRLRKRFEAGDFDEAVRASQVLLGTAATLPDWFLRPVWQRADALHPPLPVRGRHTLVLGDGPTAVRVAERLRAEGGLCTLAGEGPSYERLDAAAYRVGPDGFGKLLDSLAADGREPDRVLLLPAESADPAESLLAFARALIDRHDPGRPLPLLFATTGAQAVTAQDRPGWTHATAVGLLKSLREEHPWLRAVHVDLPPGGAPDIDVLLAEAATAPVDAEVAHRGGQRHVRRLAPLPDPLPRRTPPGDAGFHLVTGGLGGVGVELAEHLLKSPGARLLLLGRTASGEAERLRGLGDVRFAAADVTDAGQVRAAVREAAKAWGVPLTSVLHLAGVFDERPVRDLDRGGWRAALTAKVRGALVLHEIAAEHPVDSFILFSSVNGFFGGAMNAAYSAANAFLDALAVHRRGLGLPGQSLAWSMWRERGMSRGYGLTSLTEARGYRVLDTAAALRSFDFARSLDEPHLLIGADRTAPWVRSHVVAPVRQVRRLAARVALDEGTDLGALCLAATRDAPAGTRVLRSAGTAPGRSADAEGDEALRRLEARLAEVWCRVLGRDRVDRDENFFDLGGNSLLMVGAQAAIDEELGCRSEVVDLFAHPTVRALARHLSDRGTVAAPQPDAAPTGLDRARQQAQRQRAARGARRSVRERAQERKDRADG
ncbi:amino acid adenylation domain-containing protein [Streptomyces sp. MUM 136J]|uniref:non-ribosomal peptide synthetase n=1 Tax=Streptomyces sp. MUM 136J TaxID=2791992 RepID=UPI001F04E650|nr:non-ribosomal peptide synthetase [Streptomyces sp. MUM 136J]MCH0570371.1 amino acid adenylation domain-containing protein [Streptomyces sp. MUM 136J]